MIRIVKFETRYPANREPEDWVLVAPKGEAFDKVQTWHRISKIDPNNFPQHRQNGQSFMDAQAKWTEIEPRYMAWKAGNELPDEGTPLEAWSGVSAQQVKVLKGLDVRTVEDVRDMNDSTMSKLRIPNARQLPKLAAEYLSGADSAEKDAKIAEMEERLAAMSEAMEEMTAANKAPRSAQPRKRSHK